MLPLSLTIVSLSDFDLDKCFSCVGRSALDELAGRGGRGLDDDQRCLSARGLLQFMRARSRENSLAAAPTDLLPASTVCQVSHDGVREFTACRLAIAQLDVLAFLSRFS